jgi:hypothetical protein
MTASGQPNTLTITTPLNGSARITGQIGNTAGKVVGGIGGAIGGLIGGGSVGKQIDNFAVKSPRSAQRFPRQRGGDVAPADHVIVADRAEPRRPARFRRHRHQHCRHQGQPRERDQAGARSARQQ